MSNFRLNSILFAALASFLFVSCEEENPLGPMEFKFTGLRDTSILLGGALDRTVSVVYLGGEQEEVSLSISGLPNGTSAVFQPDNLLEAGESLTLRLESAANADTGMFTLAVTGSTAKGSAITRTFNLQVSRVPNTAPKIFLTGNATTLLSLNTPYVEPGYSAGDEQDGDLTANVIVSGNVNKDSVGLYSIHYVVTDSEGASDSVTRIVNVRNDLYYVSGQYNANTTNIQSGNIRNWITTISASVSQNNVFKIFKISDCFQADPLVTYNPQLDSLFLQPQSFTCITATDTLLHTFEGRGIKLNGNPLRIRIDYTDNYIDQLGNPVSLQLRDEYQLF
ncbi:MAG: DUF5011 domain-containing protein [Bacteroidota bacterium]